MGLREVQTLTARLYVDRQLRNRFFEDCTAVAEQFGLSAEEAEALQLLSQEQVEGFAASLKRKRLGEVRNLLPLTAKALADALPQLFFAFAERGAPRGIARHAVDAIAFSDHLVTVASVPAWITALARYEASYLTAQRASRCFLIRRFDFDLPQVVRQLLDGQHGLPPIRRKTLVLWIRPTARGRLRCFRFYLI